MKVTISVQVAFTVAVLILGSVTALPIEPSNEFLSEREVSMYLINSMEDLTF
ncbi:hypothetical protein K493DRAFT_319504 [Basidiobolus meristosporus CBS 931.73]|uniref:Uncharacterized protein n=1 Tax=Basidiobolus meristosporus CBS 931.73 TaxID=1314790 RepID=A0A1Y1XSU0_9FUNG|nr:hypothetical protein K493DRAFT_319503 [Basidiobolus meristosporus CBS 931.73]ORX88376.1 hypothetical protein K493DRAFT_319504 [Basidiobolus meristosporus CBS 931.73]|eukprot:ORX88374.1 hypothetical protein K493DRAFT_319503 [Basidiobolus meristosporus CBS 931.73]